MWSWCGVFFSGILVEAPPFGILNHMTRTHIDTSRCFFSHPRSKLEDSTPCRTFFSSLVILHSAAHIGSFNAHASAQVFAQDILRRVILQAFSKTNLSARHVTLGYSWLFFLLFDTTFLGHPLHRRWLESDQTRARLCSWMDSLALWRTPLQTQVMSSKFCIDVSSEHTPINFLSKRNSFNLGTHFAKWLKSV